MGGFRTPQGVAVRLDRASPGDRFKDRDVFFGSYGDTPAVIKVYPATAAGRRDALREQRGLLLLQARAIPAPRVLHLGPCPDPPGWCLVMEQVGDGMRTPVTRDFLFRVVATVAAHHRAGLVQNDLSPSNFVADGACLVTLDGATIRAAGRLGEDAAVRNLAKLFYKLSPAWNDLLPELASAYFDAQGVAATPRRCDRVLATCARLRRQRAWPQARRSLGTHRWFLAEDLPDGARLVVDRRLAGPAEARAWAADPAAVPRGEVCRLAEPPLVRRGAGFWVAQQILERLEVPTRRPMALLQARRHSLLWLTPMPPARPLPDALAGLTAEAAARQADQVGDLLRRLTIPDFELVIRDLAWDDFRVGADGPLLDLAPGQPLQRAWRPAWRREWRRVLAALAASLPDGGRGLAGALERVHLP